MSFWKRAAVAGAGLACLIGAVAAGPSVALADQPKPWQLNLQESASPLMDRIISFHDLLLWIIVAISLFVLALLVVVMVRFRAKANPVPSTNTHNTLIEIVWTVVPIMILVVIAIPSFRLLYYSDKATEATLTIKARGHQWYWSYVYESSYKVAEVTEKDKDGKDVKAWRPVDEAGRPIAKGGTAKPVETLKDGTFSFASRLSCRDRVKKDDREQCEKENARHRELYKRDVVRLLDVTNPVVIPVGTQVRVLVTSLDVIHAWTIPAMGAKVDAVPGRVNEIWIYAKKPGFYYGQCSELCGADHGFMPIAVRAVSREDYEAWLQESLKRARDGRDEFEFIPPAKKTASR
jgi:cytochrome c oxidase subunit 2